MTGMKVSAGKGSKLRVGYIDDYEQIWSSGQSKYDTVAVKGPILYQTVGRERDDVYGQGTAKSAADIMLTLLFLL